MRRPELDQLLTTMLASQPEVSDLLFTVDRPPQVEAYGELKPVVLDPPIAKLSPFQIETIAMNIIGDNLWHIEDLLRHGSCDASYSLSDQARFRVNIFSQRGSFSIVCRQLNASVPTLTQLKFPEIFTEIPKEKTGLVLITGATGSGKSTTLAAILDEINRTKPVHIVTLEDPVEYLHKHQVATFNQRELGLDFDTYANGLRAALRQAPKIIFVGEIRDRDTMEIALTAGETGHVVYSTLHTISAGQTINRILGMFSKDEEQQVRERLVGSLRYIISQRLVPKKGGGRMLATELMGSNMRIREAIALGENDNRRLADIIEAGSTNGWHSFEQSLVKAFEQDLITEETALLNCINKSAMHQRIDYVKKTQQAAQTSDGLKLRMDKNPTATPPPKLPTLPPTEPPRPSA